MSYQRVFDPDHRKAYRVTTDLETPSGQILVTWEKLEKYDGVNQYRYLLQDQILCDSWSHFIAIWNNRWEFLDDVD